jgi:holo-[acyl-carrier protein] synthase
LRDGISAPGIAPQGGLVLGVGIDAVDVERFRRVITRTPRMVQRVFTEVERSQCSGRGDLAQRLGARFAAKEAVMKALSTGLWTIGLDEISTESDEDGAPSLHLSGRAADRAERLGVTGLAVSLTHTDTVAAAIVLALGPTAGPEREAG